MFLRLGGDGCDVDRWRSDVAVFAGELTDGEPPVDFHAVRFGGATYQGNRRICRSGEGEMPECSIAQFGQLAS